MDKVEIKKTDELMPGDTIEMHYKTFGGAWLQAAHLALIEKKLNADPRFDVRRITWPNNQRDRLVLTIDIIELEPEPEDLPVQQAGAGTTITVAVLVLLIGTVFWLSLDKIYKLTKSPAGKIATAGLGAMGLAAGITTLLALFQRGKK